MTATHYKAIGIASDRMQMKKKGREYRDASMENFFFFLIEGSFKWANRERG